LHYVNTTSERQVPALISAKISFWPTHYNGSTAATSLEVPMSALFIIFIWRYSPQWARASSFSRYLDHTRRRTTVGRTPLDEWSARRRDLYLTTHNTHNRQTSIPAVGFEPTISAGERPQTYASDRTSTRTALFIYEQ